MTAFFAALQFLLLTPRFIRREFTASEMGKSVGFYPLVGLLLGAILAISDALLGLIFPIQVRSVLVLAVWVILTGGLHLDGFLDSCDGLLGGFTPEHRLEIMRDERAGAYALAGGTLLMLILFSALSAITAGRWVPLLLAPALGRWGISMAVVIFPYAREAGLGRDIKNNAGRQQLIMATATVLTAISLAAALERSWAPLIALATASLVFWLCTQFVLRRIPGMTGDTYGAINLLIEAGALLAFAARL